MVKNPNESSWQGQSYKFYNDNLLGKQIINRGSVDERENKDEKNN